jgi:6-phosphofructokinase 2
MPAEKKILPGFLMTHIVTFTPNPAIDVTTSVGKLEPMRKLRCAPAQRDPGGGGINVARVITRLGGDVTALFPAGGAAGESLRQLIDAEGVRSVTVSVELETREDFTVHEKASGAEYRFVMPGPQLRESEWQSCLNTLTGIARGAGFIVASGSLPPGVPDDLYARSARLALALGAKLVLDTSGAPLAAAMSAGIFLLKPSRRELSSLAGKALETEAQCIAAARSLVEEGKAEIVALTLGEQGALLVTGREVLRARPLAVSVVSTVGAGDSFLGAMVWSLSRGGGIREAFRYGAAAGSAALLTSGTRLCEADKVREFYGKIVIEAA